MAYTDPGAYSSKYQKSLENVLDQISNREKFSYDFNADPMYQQYKDQYTALGNQAATNAATNASSLTGGYGNSYAVTAGQQANQQYLTQLNGVIPELYQAAQAKYNADTENLYNQFNAFGTQEDREYNKWQTANSNYQWQKDYDQNKLESDRSYKLDVDKFNTENEQWQKTFDQNKLESDRNYQLDVNKFNTDNEHWQKEYDTGNYQWQKEYEQALKEYQTSTEQWQKTFDQNKLESDRNYQLDVDQFDWQKSYQQALLAKSGSSGGGSGSKSGSGSYSNTSYGGRSNDYIAAGAAAVAAAASATKRAGGYSAYSNPSQAKNNNLSNYFKAASFAYNNNGAKGITSYLSSMVNQGKISTSDATKLRNQILAGNSSYKAM